MNERKTFTLESFMNNGRRVKIEVTLNEDDRERIEQAWIENKKILIPKLDDNETSSFAFDGNQIAIFTLVPFLTSDAGKEKQ